MKIAYFIHGRGRGHSSRAIGLIEKLIASNHIVRIFAGNDALDVLKPFKDVTPINSTVPYTTWFPFFYRCYQDYIRLKKEKPDCVISDGDAPSVYAAKFLGIHVIAIGHSMIFPYARHPFSISRRKIFKENITVRWATLIADYKFIVHFCKIDIKIKKALLVRPDLTIPEIEETTEINTDGKFLLSYFRDGNGHGLAKALVDKGFRIFNFGSFIELDGVENHKLNSRLFLSIMKKAAGVVGSSGSNLISEAIYLDKPLLLTYHPKDFEQSMNAKYAEYIQSGIGIPLDNYDTKKLQKFIDSISKKKIEKNVFKDMPQLSNVVEQYLNNKFS